MKPRIKLLPLWCITNTRPAFYDIESDTAVEMVGKVYAAMRELQTDYNKYVTEINKTITDFITGINQDQEEFECKITKIIHDYIITIDSKMDHQDRKIDETIVYIKENLQIALTEIIAEMKETGALDESILNAIDGIGARVINLEEATATHTASIENLITRVISLESNHLTTEYETEKKKLFIYMSNERSVEV